MNNSPPTYEEQVAFFKNHLKTNGGIEIFIKHLLSEGCGLQTVHTPFEFCRTILEKLDEYAKLEGKSIAILFNLELLHVLIRNYHIPPKNITIFVDDEREFEFARLEYGMIPDVNLFYIDMEKTAKTKRLHTPKGEVMKKFDVIAGNPPYQPSVNRSREKGDGGSGSGCVIWDKFVTAGMDLLKPNGFLCFVHPAKWRKPADKLGTAMRKHQIHYLEIHNKQEGLKTFGATTRYDWYVLQNCIANGPTIIKEEGGGTVKMDITKWPLIPNAQFKLVEKVLAKPGEETCPLLFDGGTYDRRRPWMQTEKDSKHIYPCVTSTGRKGVRCYYSNTKDKGLFGTPKLIFSDADIIAHAIVDWKGEYAMTQHAMAIPIESKEEGESMKKALESPEFNAFLKACRWSNFQIEWQMFKYFRKDFWKEFAVETKKTTKIA